MLNLQQEHINELYKIFNNYCPKAEIWAYGSRLTNNCHSGSDLDLVVKNFNEENKFVYELAELITNSNVPFLVDIHQFDSFPKSFQDEIMKNYVKFYGN